tara:strand:+ start:2401 stop:2814 length:414 start_codon:yes stop_codon:yes gene_type:complete
MGFLTYYSPTTKLTDDIMLNSNDIDTDKDYFILDKINIENTNDSGIEKINVHVTLNIYSSYEERLERNNLLMSKNFILENLIDKEFSDNLWNKCYIKIKGLILEQNTNDLKEILELNDNDLLPNQYQYLLEIEDHFN